MNALHYLQLATLSPDLLKGTDADALTQPLRDIASSATTPAAIEPLYRYLVPKLGEGGACSLFDELDEQPYDLAPILGSVSAANTRALTALRALFAAVAQATAADWLGIYAKRTLADGSQALVKLAYHGKPSRAEFPLTAEFAEHSNNSSVGLSGQGKLIDDVASWVAEGGAYYTCDPAVRSEACLPLFDAHGQLCGIIDAEDARAGWFSGERLAHLVALCLVAPQCLPE